MRIPATGRASIFRNKLRSNRVQGLLSAAGARAFESARRRLARLAGWKATKVSDADTIEYLGRGDGETKAYLEDRDRGDAGGWAYVRVLVEVMVVSIAGVMVASWIWMAVTSPFWRD